MGMKNIIVKIGDDRDSLCGRALSIFKDRIMARCNARVYEGDDGAAIVISVDITLPFEAFRIEDASGAICISGGSARGLLYGIGKFLRTSGYSDGFTPSSWRGTDVPQGLIRGMYFATHFHNWYHVAPEEELVRYIEDMALWGVNALKVIYPFINLKDWNDPEAASAMTMLRRCARTAHELGLMFVTGVSNTMFSGAPKELSAAPLKDLAGRRGNHGFPVCPSNPDGHAYIIENTRKFFEQLSNVGVDLLMLWPYDEGGCGCEKCLPWGSNGFYKLSRDLTLLGREYFPGMKSIMSTWMFDTPPEGEWDGISQKLEKSNDWLDYILADSHEDFPLYPLHNGVPGNLPLLNFPEISMWGLWPWGGFGANPLPRRFQRLWNQAKNILAGGFPYSEGIYEDINKAIVIQFYWNRDRTAEETMREYIAYEYSPSVTGDILHLISLLETTHAQGSLRDCRTRLRRYRESYSSPELIKEGEHSSHIIETDLNNIGAKLDIDLAIAEGAKALALKIDAELPVQMAREWRWRILFLRSVLEYPRLTDGLNSPETRIALRELIDIFHSRVNDDGSDPYHRRVRPPLE